MLPLSDLFISILKDFIPFAYLDVNIFKIKLLRVYHQENFLFCHMYILSITYTTYYIFILMYSTTLLFIKRIFYSIFLIYTFYSKLLVIYFNMFSFFFITWQSPFPCMIYSSPAACDEICQELSPKVLYHSHLLLVCPLNQNIFSYCSQ